ncbi:hypothetical protein C7999DRAFT_17744 [Corynascus novoguineensis]|uniref:Uncharacterized protein n=1 Tax=Corynascus novoguineensis TaxID=1126955 RepID=A0AAN7HJ49_9PEZI|nr:hypothetical protein C7999DRAFT_17744 [Corynascus novoguineensis]
MSLAQPGPTAAKLRSILVKVTPAPTTLSERHAVLGVLKKYADVEVFKKLHDPSHFVSIVAQPQMALNLIAKSPLEFEYAARRSATRLVTPNTTTTEPKTFLVKIVENPDYKHRTHIRESLTYGRWPEHEQQRKQRDAGAQLFVEDSLPRASLSAICPPGIASAGLADWESAGQLGEDEGLATWLSGKADFVQARQMKKARNATAFESLVEAYERGKGGRKT